MNTEPFVIGYWARHHNLTLEDILAHGTLSEHVNDRNARSAFADGWETRKFEETQERVKGLLDTLRNVRE